MGGNCRISPRKSASNCATVTSWDIRRRARCATGNITASRCRWCRRAGCQSCRPTGDWVTTRRWNEKWDRRSVCVVCRLSCLRALTDHAMRTVCPTNYTVSMTTGRPLYNRRSFLRHSALAGTALALAGEAPTPADEWAQGWFGRPMRWAQLTLAEDDPGTYDLNFWLDYFRRTHSDAACLSAGGC